MESLVRSRMTIIVRQRCCSREGLLSGLEILNAGQGGGGQGPREEQGGAADPLQCWDTCAQGPAGIVMVSQRKYEEGSLGQAGDSRSRCIT